LIPLRYERMSASALAPAPISSFSSAAMPTYPTSASSPSPIDAWSSTATTSTRPALARSSGTWSRDFARLVATRGRDQPDW